MSNNIVKGKGHREHRAPVARFPNIYRKKRERPTVSQTGFMTRFRQTIRKLSQSSSQDSIKSRG